MIGSEREIGRPESADIYIDSPMSHFGKISSVEALVRFFGWTLYSDRYGLYLLGYNCTMDRRCDVRDVGHPFLGRLWVLHETRIVGESFSLYTLLGCRREVCERAHYRLHTDHFECNFLHQVWFSFNPTRGKHLHDSCLCSEVLESTYRNET